MIRQAAAASLMSIAALLVSPPPAQANDGPGEGFEVISYRLALTPDIPNRTVAGRETIALRITDARVQTLGFTGNALTIDSATIDGICAGPRNTAKAHCSWTTCAQNSATERSGRACAAILARTRAAPAAAAAAAPASTCNGRWKHPAAGICSQCLPNGCLECPRQTTGPEQGFPLRGKIVHVMIAQWPHFAHVPRRNFAMPPQRTDGHCIHRPAP